MKMWDSSVRMDPKVLHVTEVWIWLKKYSVFIFCSNVTNELLIVQMKTQDILNCETELIPIQSEAPNKMKFHPELTSIH